MSDRPHDPLIKCPDTGRVYEPLSRFRKRLGIADPGYSGRPVDDPDGESAALDQEARDVADELDQAEALTRERLAGGELERRRDAIMSEVRGKTWADLLDEYDEALISWRELDHSAKPRYKALRAQVEAALSATPPPGVWHSAGGFVCAASGCHMAAATNAGYVGPWHQLVELGWRRNAGGAWECPGPHGLVSA